MSVKNLNLNVFYCHYANKMRDILRSEYIFVITLTLSISTTGKSSFSDIETIHFGIWYGKINDISTRWHIYVYIYIYIHIYDICKYEIW